ncbi:MAG: 1-(5-phosphoribosyl)-5-[(5-phosphoribosylamino)methylideneamino]imidazole-4-carboxamide isomerase [Oscillospiraceae bacterium]|nr:1-(5-phosphoribosyl)-5-[(5-phosphoribosylamino)methylideneamino]imidazole-4-carboxamide isomerase [Oscillospiraceae bacterium]
MDLYPAIDLCGGKAVRLLHGDYEKMTVYSDSPVEVARGFKAAGATFLHLVDLDGAKSGDTSNYEIIRKIVDECGLQVEVGGGIRGMETAERYLGLGVMRVIVGTAAVTDSEFLAGAIKRFGEKIAVAVDIKNGLVATHGWTRTSGEDCFGFCGKIQNIGVKTLICTDISKDGAMRGVNRKLYEDLAERFSMDIIASGGVSSINDLRLLAETGVRGAILGKSLYTGSVDLAEAIDVIKKAECK